jgi:tetrahydromethanopterin S-methyltransferase subunit E
MSDTYTNSYTMPYTIPSIYAHLISGALFIVAFIIFVYNYKNIVKLEPYKRITIILLFSIVVGIHGLSHLGLESEYNMNPIYSILLLFYEFFS